ncbi:copper transport repressor, CopY/TcrY family [Streptococcus sp. CM6]|uniref:Copper transport repressor, CopY/TcrY family n=2 Tax=Streptococcus oralis TaxID=1303 RepID=F9Q2C9_STROR|nr:MULTISPECIES: CopY/TcrY family copper transport repressor [Streptococcus]EGV02259.1 copper transport repressor, CopY/TcrY family [Streptococcus oralis SK313]EUC81765.1 copper transport repressor, CopY/TcrY family [Streptococcus sp. CM6]KJQ77335.1 COPAB ATPase metal-fist type repressor [Streptococcus oralis subsp. tigurinus]NIB85168.1 CopY/TcrY family copper transport repressor [Streptococcus sp. CCUG 71758]ORJ29190.1 uracil phosphoribosyltransferase [Streptococcus oralis subsp. tigurinus]
MQISDAEWQVMKIIWMQGEQTSRDLIRVLAERFDWSKSTVQTLLARLVEKECLTRKKEGKSFVYSALLTLDQSRDLLVRDIKDKVCSRRMKQLVADLIAECDFTQADLADLEAVISEKKASAVAEVKCNCM